VVSESSKCGVESFLPDTVGSTGEPRGVLSALAVMTISCINNPYLNTGTTVALVHVQNSSFISHNEERK